MNHPKNSNKYAFLTSNLNIQELTSMRILYYYHAYYYDFFIITNHYYYTMWN